MGNVQGLSKKLGYSQRMRRKLTVTARLPLIAQLPNNLLDQRKLARECTKPEPKRVLDTVTGYIPKIY